MAGDLQHQEFCILLHQKTIYVAAAHSAVTQEKNETLPQMVHFLWSCTLRHSYQRSLLNTDLFICLGYIALQMKLNWNCTQLATNRSHPTEMENQHCKPMMFPTQRHINEHMLKNISVNYNLWDMLFLACLELPWSPLLVRTPCYTRPIHTDGHGWQKLNVQYWEGNTLQ